MTRSRSTRERQSAGRDAPYQRIVADIEMRIQKADLRPGEILPTRSELALTYATARATVDKAFAELARKGLIESGSGKRTRVAVRTGRVATAIGVLWHWPVEQERLSEDFLDQLFRGVREACAEFMLETHFRAAPLHSWEDFVASTGAQGLLAIRPDYADSSVLARIRESGTPVVAVPGILGQAGVPGMSADNAGGISRAVDHLVQLGHRDIGFLSLTATLPDHFERLQAFLEAVARHSLPIQPNRIHIDHEQNPTEFERALEGWLTPDNLPTAIVSADFLMTLAVLRRLHTLEARIPDDVSVVTFDDPPMAAKLAPPLTAVSQAIPLLGYRAVGRLVELIEGRPVAAVEHLPTELRVRGSTTTPRHPRHG